MGSTGTGSFSDYPGSQGGRPEKGGGGSSGGGGSGGDNCEMVISGMMLEDVANCEYFLNHDLVPKAGTQVQARVRLVKGRVAVETTVKGEVIGYVPTKYNYLRACMTDGWQYSGNVVEATGGQLPKVKIDLSPSHD